MSKSLAEKIKMVSSETMAVELLQTGDIRKISCGATMINQLLGNHIDGMAQNLFLRIYSENGFDVYALMGKRSKSRFAISGNQIIYSGEIKEKNISYNVFLTLMENIWFYDVEIENSGSPRKCDIVYSQDIGLAAQGHVQGNEAYNSQYIDHKVFETENGYIVCSRQNQRQSTGFPFLQQGSLANGGTGKTRAYSIDGYPFFGYSYKFNNMISDLYKETLNNRVYQYEFAFTALQTEEINLEKSAKATFYGVYMPTIETAVEKPFDIQKIVQMHEEVKFKKPESFEPEFIWSLDVGNIFSSAPMTNEEIDTRYENKRHVEYHDGKLISFFKDTFEHVVLAEKENYAERSHGHIILSGNNDNAGDNTLASTSYIYGVFNSQIVLGNTSFNKLMSNCRNGLNVQKSSGQRIMVKIDGEYKLLAMPAVYELGFNYAKWLYKINGDVLEIICYTAFDKPLLTMDVRSESGKKYDFILFAQMCNAPGEYDEDINIERDGGVLKTRHKKGTISSNTYPGLEFVMSLDREFELFDDSRFYENAGTMHEPIMAIEIFGADSFSFNVEGRIDGSPVEKTGRDFDEEVKIYREWLGNGINNFNLSLNTSDADVLQAVEKCNDISMWYSHNARIHYASPHGLEQYGGAAWGARDVCQGPFEYFIATQNYPVASDILKKIFTHQYIEDGSWPQWYMFDKYYKIQNDGSHGDVIVWPIKALSHYLLHTGDTAILDAKVPYTTKNGFGFTDEIETIFDHVKKEIAYIRNNFINGTHLSCYGDGDWDDTLQPANAELRKSMVSGWTVTLTYQAFKEFAEGIYTYDSSYADEIEALAEAIKEDYHKYIIKDGIVSGFIVFEGDKVKYLLHPLDQETGLHYRLLPMTRSMIGGMFTTDEMKSHFDLLKKHLYHADGVRLMDTTCRYKGGVNTYFMRAETAANFGREIGLQYVHAHIRFIEAMAKIGNAEEAWSGLMKINPVMIDNVVKNAAKRQSNCYYSSSDGAFDNRYEAMEGFGKLRTGDIPVKAGWRIYSSGSGIYLNQMICNCLGLRRSSDNVIIDPVLPVSLDGLEFGYKIDGKPVKIVYHLSKECGVTSVKINGGNVQFDTLNQQYRDGGAVFPVSLIGENAKIDVYVG